MKSGDLHLQSRLRLGTAMLVVSLAAGSLSACTTVEKGWNSTKGAVTGLFSDDDKAAPPDQTAEAEAPAETPAATPSAPAPMTGGLFMGSQSAASAFQTSQPSAPEPAAASTEPEPAKEEPKPKKAAAKKAEPKKEEKVEPEPEPKKAEPKNIKGLVADTEKAAYTETSGRRAPVTVRPLNESAVAEASAPPRPVAAPVEQVARLQGDLAPAAPAAPAASAPAAPPAAAPRATELAERLDAPAPTPASSIPDAPVAAPAPVAPAPAQVAALPPPMPQALVPAAPSSSIVGYGDDTLVVDSSGTRGGRNVIGAPLASAGSGGFDPGNSSVSSEVGSISFAPGSSTLSAEGKAILADAARLRAQTDGAIRIVGRGDQATARAAAVSRELRRLGVPAARLYDGGADNTMLGDAADIYLDY